MKTIAEGTASLQERADAYYWHHSIDLGNGIVTKGATSLEMTNRIASALLDGLSMKGKSLLDIGAWNGAYSFEAKRRGCERVVASDKFCWTHPEINGRPTFDIAQEALGFDIEAMEIDVPDITAESVGEFDAVLFSGVFYHLINPVHLTRQIAACAKHLLILETHQDLLDYERPGMVFYPGRTLANDDTNWWGPNPRAVYEILKEIGFARVFYQDPPQYDDPRAGTFRKRGLFHAFRTEQSVKQFKATNAKWMDLEIPEVRERVFAPLISQTGAQEILTNALKNLEMMREENVHLKRELDGMRAQLAAATNHSDAIMQSTSWKMTAPFRAISSTIRR